MKYVISDQGEVKIGGGYHFALAHGFKGKVISAGHCDKQPDGSYRVYGESIGLNIKAKPEDAEILNKIS